MDQEGKAEASCSIAPSCESFVILEQIVYYLDRSFVFCYEVGFKGAKGRDSEICGGAKMAGNGHLFSS